MSKKEEKIETENNVEQLAECRIDGEVKDDEIQRLTTQLEDWKDKYIRCLADMENTKRRLEIDLKNAVDYNSTQFAKSLLPVADSLSLALRAMDGKVDAAVLDGIKSVQSQLDTAFNARQIAKVETVGKPLDPMTMLVIAQVPSDKPENEVLEELQAGYTIGQKIIREAMVSVAKKN
ncbi:MAG: nucleotide exchange factor GrpE [Alphaproteobacteria bacterium]|nr:nucleotide exchange factor GrpE [Alphaproteobacteria bacterium]